MDDGVARAVGEGLLDPGVAQRVRIVARLARGGTISGQALAEELGVSRAAVHKHIELLRSARVGVSSAPGSGYVLEPPGDHLLPETILPLLLGVTLPPAPAKTVVGLPYLYEPRTGSTNEMLKSRAQGGLPGGALAVTDYQVEGKGRLGRTWVCEEGKDLTFSVLLRPSIPPVEACRLVLAASVAVAEVLGRIRGLEDRVGIKWPNDVQIDGRKVCGILAEASMDMDSLHWVVIGIGLNVNGSPAAAIADRAGAEQETGSMSAGDGRPGNGLTSSVLTATSLAEWVGEPLPRGSLLIRLVRQLRRRWAAVEGGRWETVRAAYSRRDALAGSDVVVRSGLGRDLVVAAGRAEGLGPDGGLLVRAADGTMHSVTAGEVTLASR
ncbi:MAG: biotin--[acetyl-CoA-carboxylase] ligase [Thermoleophilia bacterium]